MCLIKRLHPFIQRSYLITTALNLQCKILILKEKEILNIILCKHFVDCTLMAAHVTCNYERTFCNKEHIFDMKVVKMKKTNLETTIKVMSLREVT